MSMVDGPGVRMVVFEQGCAMRCKFCSNPDTWSPCSGEVVSSKDIAAQLHRCGPATHAQRSCWLQAPYSLAWP